MLFRIIVVLFRRNPGPFLFTWRECSALSYNCSPLSQKSRAFFIYNTDIPSSFVEIQGSFGRNIGLFCGNTGLLRPYDTLLHKRKILFCIMWKYRTFGGNTGLICGNTGLICGPVTCPSTSARYCFLMRRLAKRRCKPIYAFFVWQNSSKVSYSYIYIHIYKY